jgi:hypothetical protein
MAEDMRRSSGQPVMRTASAGAGQVMMIQPSSSSKLPWVVLVLVIVVLAVFGFLFRDKLFGAEGAVKGAFTDGTYKAVFLTNGQVYFGKLDNAGDQYASLSDIYYLQVSPTQGSQNADQAVSQQQQQGLTLVKLGQELHGPVDAMKINRDQILFYEDIKEDGRVMQAIREYQKNPEAANGQSQSQAPNGSAVNGASTGTNTNTGR